MAFPRAQRLHDIVGFGIDQVAAAADHPPSDRPVLRLENLDTDLPLPPEAVEVTRAALEDPISNSWLPFTGDHDLRAAIADHVHGRTGHRFDPEREIAITCGGTEAVLDILLATIDPGDEVVLTDPIYAGLVNRVRLAGGTPVLAPLRVEQGEWRLDHKALKAAIGPRTKALLFDGRELIHPLHLEGMAERTVIAGSMSKEHRMIGWRVGWIAGPAPVALGPGDYARFDGSVPHSYEALGGEEAAGTLLILTPDPRRR